MKWHIGCSGFLYRDWKNIFYPPGIPQRSWLNYYSTQFDTLEINSSFYKFPEDKNLKKFYDQTEENFQFALKAPRVITHFEKLKNCDAQFSDLYAAAQNGLKEKLGPILFQFPPSFLYSPENMEAILKSFKPEFKNVVEFRNDSWFNVEVEETLCQNEIIMSGLSHPILKEKQAIIKTCGTIYYRFHGIERLFYSAYAEKAMEDFYIEATESGAEEIFVYFNNTASLAAIENALYLKKIIAINA
ncbi:MAG: DUF72 domain-containing protein [Ginsengibacter sp.]